jgi:tetratricopeptide (TPR) repeat protein
MKKLIAFIVFGFAINLSFAQNFNDDQIEQWEEANERFELTDYYGAWEIYLELRKADKDYPELNFKTGVCLFMLKGDTYEVLRYLEEASFGKFTEAYYYMGRSYHLLEKFQMAVKYYNYYKENDNGNTIPLEEVDRHIDIALRAKEMTKAKTGIEVTNVGKAINTEFSDYVPLVTGNDSMMVFTSRRKGSTGGELDPYNNYFEDIYYSFKKGEEWTPAENIGNALNTNTHDACVGMSADGKTLIMFRTNEDLSGGDLYSSNNEDGVWSAPKKLSENINSDYQEASASLTADGNMLYFSSNRPGGYGGKDLYRSVRFGNGDWSLPLNLGPTVNTVHDDDAPFISADDNTLYFSSKGHMTLGGFDVFKSSKEEEKWQQPISLGYPINSVGDDIYLVVTQDEEIAYYSSGRQGGAGGQDIYRIVMVDKNQFVTIVKGKILDDKGAPVKGKITVIDELTNKVQGVYRSNDKSGKYIMLLKPKVTYKIIVDAKQYKTVNDNILLDFDDNFVEVAKDFKLIAE